MVAAMDDMTAEGTSLMPFPLAHVRSPPSPAGSLMPWARPASSKVKLPLKRASRQRMQILQTDIRGKKEPMPIRPAQRTDT